QTSQKFPCVECGIIYCEKVSMVKHFLRYHGEAKGSSGDASQPGSQASSFNNGHDTVLGRTCWSNTLAAKKKHKGHATKCPGSLERKLQSDTIIITDDEIPDKEEIEINEELIPTVIHDMSENK
ncbi:unnamed protein product, partial [Meganyctiphanes norvegica]